MLVNLLLFVLLFGLSRAEKKKDLYKVLGVPKTASQAEIKQAYRKLSLKMHPDRNKDDPHANEKFAEIGNAYEVLSNPTSRQQYDATGSTEKINSFSEENSFSEWNPFGNGNPFADFGGFHFSFGGSQFNFGGSSFPFGSFDKASKFGKKCVSTKKCDSHGNCKTVTHCT
ncbi:putative DnaJ subfamily C member 10 precursor (ER-resident protein ERDJ5) [Monocercomonoides exilis]|uniref:putative DnaJ subfamily C member 10 precursor (ER-resident protein ERDJ5) n=1 Tax=Monocercomonoides exilis TaxID=2049356 RepID=UPI00355A00FE|nr:putative DnaJ subfamily C member 10 precursor (ER-resident protein ERDJ5) [Monocercomonoides exilis]|eukprot:MONOS_6368.1-p1 / transcript=MONOS_6368.1 / gene=MONOS_6368 / organism=Monocercomonoides_exilis_PA203 / gene_product=DnaJ homolog subfamily C member 10 precursor (ER-resident protein ERDJ5) / transcript_product=DnaJ homolog subfamily C member 10 precursor (ER-resident protein ERDJ5) / location=Mono_scaffold00199:90317-90956(-) / protein_length=170 / sequence_SO=supercontig / SO=protein_coding / is_pseudo=false